MNKKYRSIIISILICSSILSPKPARAGPHEDQLVSAVSISTLTIAFFLSVIIAYCSEQMRRERAYYHRRPIAPEPEVFTGAFTPTRVHFNDEIRITQIPARQNPFPPMTNELRNFYQQLFTIINRQPNLRDRVLTIQEYFYNHQRVFFDRDTLEPLAQTANPGIFIARIHSLPNFNSWAMRGLDQDQLRFHNILQFYINLLNPPRQDLNFLLTQLHNLRDQRMFDRMIRHLRGETLPEADRNILEIFCQNVLVIEVPEPWLEDSQ